MSAEQYAQLVDVYPWVVGIDEVGLGSWAGPLYVTACLVITNKYFDYPGLKDSKDLSEKWREDNYDRLVASVGGPPNIRTAVRSCEEIDRHGVGKALESAIHQVVHEMVELLLGKEQQALFVMDGDRVLTLPQQVGLAVAWPKADTFVPACMAAANIAKTQRDRYMRSIAEEDERYALFGFGQNKGYRSPEHEQALTRHGITNEHRVSYRPIKKLLYSEGRTPK